MKRVLTFGTFDGLHAGHKAYLSFAQAMGDLWVVVARDETVRRIKKHAPRHSEDDRYRAVAEAFPSAHVQLGDTEDYSVPLVAVNPDLIVLGYDQQLPPGIDPSYFPCPVVRAPAFEPETYKSTLIRKREEESSQELP
jgi:cytidyltransferase-like protein